MERYVISNETKEYKMSNRNNDELEELRRDMLQESREEEEHEIMMHRDVEFCVEQTNCAEALEELNKRIKLVNSYGHDIDLSELL